ncbi:MAG: arylsulfatase, partial [Pirellulales bacterium]
YTSQGEIEGIRQGKWKLLVKRPRRARRNPGNLTKPEILLFDLEHDIGEQSNLAQDHPDIVERLQRRMIMCDEEITQNARQPWFKDEPNS